MPKAAKDVLDLCARILSGYALCDRCLGRQFHLLDEEEDNEVVGASLKRALYLDHSAFLQAGKTDSLRVLRRLAVSGHHPSELAVRVQTGKDVEVKPCPICGGELFERMSDLTAKAAIESRKYQHRTFQMGSRIPRKIMGADDEIKIMYQLSHGENIKTEFNRLMARRLADSTKGVPVFAGEPDISVTVDPINRSVEVSPSPIYVAGRYRKLKPGFSQTRKRGLDPLRSVEGMLATVFVPALDASDVRFHGAGREDVDALMLGNGRPFILEILAPKRRRVSLAKLQKKFNRKFGRSVDIRGLKSTVRSGVVRLKMGGERFEKRYRIIVNVDKMPSEEKLREVETLATGLMLQQRTPQRVAWRRADRIRRRMIRSLKLRRMGEHKLEAVVQTQAGTYVKEFVTGDDGRTKPSLAELLNTPANWEALEVLRILGG
ncbi:MAG TPA: tRNA pseudouridine(54/55) synthase Pus10 [Thermoproteota archaeon]|nr:tRNA pseudouridine(54/55) synthase Pus10 [Thermoproteota archaeon]